MGAPRSAARVDRAYVAVFEAADMVDVPFHDPLIAILDAEDLDVVVLGALDGDGTDDAVDAGSWPAANDQSQATNRCIARH